MKIIFEFDKDKCSACGACAVACMDQNDIDVSSGRQPYRKTYNYEGQNGELVSMSISCMHCADAPCINACPINCLYKDKESGLTLYDNENCIGCHSCAMACPYGAPSFRVIEGPHHREKMEKCDNCIERIRIGKDPACVHSCPTGALSWRWAEDNEESPLARLYKSWNAMTTKE